MALDASIQSAIEGARGLARERGHAEATEVHLMAWLLATRSEWLAAKVDVCVARIVEGVEARLAAIPAAAGYRDPQPARLSRSLTESIASARPQGRLGFLRKARLLDVFMNIVVRTEVGAMIGTMFWDPTPVVELRRATDAFAATCGHRNVVNEHAIVGAIDSDERFTDALRVLGQDPKAVRHRLFELIVGRYRSSKLPPLPTWIKAASLGSNFARRRTLGGDFVVVGLLRNDEVEHALREVDVARDDLLYAYVHGVAASALPTGSGDVDVVLYNDDFTTLETVLQVLTEAFHCDAAAARVHVARIHDIGSAVAQRMAPRAAATAVGKAREICRPRLMPLRIETREV